MNFKGLGRSLGNHQVHPRGPEHLMAGGLDDLASSLAAVAGRLREIGEGGLARELTAAVRRATDPVPPAVRARVQEEMPHRGGYAATLDADLAISRHVFTSGDEARVIITAEARAKKRNCGASTPGSSPIPCTATASTGTPSRSPPDGRGGGPGRRAADPDEINRALDDVAAKAAGKGPDEDNHQRGELRLRRQQEAHVRGAGDREGVGAPVRRVGAGLAAGSAEALCVFAWIVWRRDGRDADLADILEGQADFDFGEFMRSLNAGAAAEEGEAEPGPPIPGRRRPRMAQL